MVISCQKRRATLFGPSTSALILILILMHHHRHYYHYHLQFQLGQTVEVLKGFVESEIGIPMSCQVCHSAGYGKIAELSASSVPPPIIFPHLLYRVPINRLMYEFFQVIVGPVTTGYTQTVRSRVLRFLMSNLCARSRCYLWSMFSIQELYLGSTLMMDPMSLLDYPEIDGTGDVFIAVEGEIIGKAKK